MERVELVNIRWELWEVSVLLLAFAIGMVSNKKSIVTIFVHNHFKPKFNIFHEIFVLANKNP